jgi:hypothetical protein
MGGARARRGLFGWAGTWWGLVRSGLGTRRAAGHVTLSRTHVPAGLSSSSARARRGRPAPPCTRDAAVNGARQQGGRYVEVARSDGES